jgi:RHS repeat-associated protein
VHNVNGTDEYAYDPANKRIWKRSLSGIEELHLYGIGGERLATYQLTWGGSWSVSLRTRNVYFVGRLVQMREAGSNYEVVAVTDRLGSVVATGLNAAFTRRRYFPYGEEQVTTASDTEKFGTYYRDQRTNLDYADQRYYSSVYGRFLTADDSGTNESLERPLSFNSYSYVEGDPINNFDPTGEKKCRDSEYIYPDDAVRGTLGDVLNTNTELGIFSAVIWAEAGKDPLNHIEKLAVAYTIVNRFLVVNNYIQVWINSDATTDGKEWINPTTLGWGTANGSLKSIIGAKGQFDTVLGGEANPQLEMGLRRDLDLVLDSDSQSDMCWNLMRAASAAITALQEPYVQAASGRLITAFSHSQGKSSRIGEQFLASLGTPNRFFGLIGNYNLNPSQTPLPTNLWKPRPRRKPDEPWRGPRTR